MLNVLVTSRWISCPYIDLCNWWCFVILPSPGENSKGDSTSVYPVRIRGSWSLANRLSKASLTFRRMWILKTPKLLSFCQDANAQDEHEQAQWIQDNDPSGVASEAFKDSLANSCTRTRLLGWITSSFCLVYFGILCSVFLPLFIHILPLAVKTAIFRTSRIYSVGCAFQVHLRCIRRPRRQESFTFYHGPSVDAVDAPDLKNQQTSANSAETRKR